MNPRYPTPPPTDEIPTLDFRHMMELDEDAKMFLQEIELKEEVWDGEG